MIPFSLLKSYFKKLVINNALTLHLLWAGHSLLAKMFFFFRFLHLKKYCWVDKNLYWSKWWVNLAEHMQLHREFVAIWKLRKKKEP